MTKHFNLFFLFSFIVLLSTSCSNKLDLLDNWKETTVVYGLLNQADTVQYIKINKAYLGTGNALQMAKQYDSINYPNELNVKLERWLNGNLVNSYPLSRDSTTIIKDSGLFAYPNQILYFTHSAIIDDSEYQLIITNLRTGNVVKGKTKLVKKISISNPSSAATIGFTNAFSPFKVKWASAENGKLYQLIIRFNYDEMDYSSGLTEAKYIDWVFPTQKSQSTSGGELMELSFFGSEFYQHLKGTLSVNSNLKRTAKKLDFLFSVATDDYNTYMEVYQPSYGIVQEKPTYTNIQNGIGLFSSRLNQSVLNRPLSNLSLDSLANGQYTSQLGFVYP